MTLRSFLYVSKLASSVRNNLELPKPETLIYFRIDKADDFADRKAFWRKLGDMGLLGITASSDYGGKIYFYYTSYDEIFSSYQ